MALANGRGPSNFSSEAAVSGPARGKAGSSQRELLLPKKGSLSENILDRLPGGDRMNTLPPALDQTARQRDAPDRALRALRRFETAPAADSTIAAEATRPEAAGSARARKAVRVHRPAPISNLSPSNRFPRDAPRRRRLEEGLRLAGDRSAWRRRAGALSVVPAPNVPISVRAVRATSTSQRSHLSWPPFPLVPGESAQLNPPDVVAVNLNHIPRVDDPSPD